MEKKEIKEIGFKSGVPVVVVMTDTSAWPYVAQIPDGTEYKFHVDKHAPVLAQLQVLKVRDGDTVQIMATLNPDKTVELRADLNAPWTQNEGTEEHAVFTLDAHERLMKIRLHRAHGMCQSIEGLDLNMESVQRIAVTLYLTYTKKFDATILRGDPDDLPF